MKIKKLAMLLTMNVLLSTAAYAADDMATSNVLIIGNLPQHVCGECQTGTGGKGEEVASHNVGVCVPCEG